MADAKDRLRQLPAVDALLRTEIAQYLTAQYGRDATVRELRRALDCARQSILENEAAPNQESILEQASRSLEQRLGLTLRPVINATGVIIHTNLGRAPLGRSALRAIDIVGMGYSNLEYDLDMGRRGSRHLHTESLICELTGAESAMVVNNNAAAVLLVLSALAVQKDVIISRGQLVEIGGGFRIPDVMRQSGARLVEVGATNRTYLRDYEAAIGPQTVAIMRAHRSNFAITGFVYEPDLADLSALAHQRGLLMLDDLGSGALLDTSLFGLSHEPMVQESIEAGADLVCASADKLLGGPQGGIIAGARPLVDQLRRHPLTRALRVDKTTLAALQVTLQSYLSGRVAEEVPVWHMIGLSLEQLEASAEAWARRLREWGIAACVVDGRSAVGGGSLPGETLPTRALALRPSSAAALVAQLRSGHPSIVARVQDDLVIFDPRTILPTLGEEAEREGEFLEAVGIAWQKAGNTPED